MRYKRLNCLHKCSTGLRKCRLSRCCLSSTQTAPLVIWFVDDDLAVSATNVVTLGSEEMTSTLLFGLKEEHFQRNCARILENVRAERRRGHRCRDASTNFERDRHGVLLLVTARPDRDLITPEDEYQVVSVMVIGILLANLHCKHTRDPRVVLLEDLVAARGNFERADVALNVAARLARRIWFDEDGMAILVADVLDLVRDRREDRTRARWDFYNCTFLTKLCRRRTACNLELAVNHKVHAVNRMFVRQVLCAGWKGHLDETSNSWELRD